MPGTLFPRLISADVAARDLAAEAERDRTPRRVRSCLTLRIRLSKSRSGSLLESIGLHFGGVFGR